MINPRVLGGVTVSRAFSAGVSYLTTIYMIARLGPEHYGGYYFWFTIMTMVAGVSAAGLNNSFVYAYSANNNPRSLERTFFSARIIIAFAISLVGLAVGYFLSSAILVVACLSGAAISLLDAQLSIVQAKKNFVSFSIWMPVRSLVILAVGVYAVEVGGSTEVVEIYTGYALGCGFLGLIVGMAQFRGFGNLGDMRALWSRSSDFWIFEIGFIVSMRIEIWALEWAKSVGRIGSVEMGHYAFAASLVAVLPIITSAVSSVLLPIYGGIKETPNNGAEKSFFRAILLTATLISGVYGLAAMLAFKLFASEYMLSYVVLLVLLSGTLISFVASMYRMRILALGAHKELRKVATRQTLVSIASALILIPTFGVPGAIISFVVARIVGCVAYRNRYAHLRASGV